MQQKKRLTRKKFLKEIETFQGTELEGTLCKHPFLDRTSRVVLGSEDTVNVELGTGKKNVKVKQLTLLDAINRRQK